MKKKSIIITLFITFLLGLYGYGVYYTANRFTQPEVKYYGLNETVEINGFSYKLLSMESYLLDEFAQKYNFKPEDYVFDDITRRYFVACVEVTKLEDSGKLSNVGEYNKYEFGYYSEVMLEMYMNEHYIGNMELTVGEPIKYYYVKSFLEYNFKEDTWSNMDESDMWLRLYDEENHYEIFLGSEL